VPYLRYYLRLVEDDWRSVLENIPMSHNFATREEEFFKCLATLLHQDVKGRLENIVLVEVRSIGAGVSTLLA
jgi:hypothetical protein